MVEAISSALAVMLDGRGQKKLAEDTTESIQGLLESKRAENKKQGLNSIMHLHQIGEKEAAQKMLMLVIRTCANVEDNELKRYLLLYFEVTGLGLENCDPERRSMFVL
ncbi:MAG: hypothetical protein EZS28_045878, partial [Streblomastix strix]